MSIYISIPGNFTTGIASDKNSSSLFAYIFILSLASVFFSFKISASTLIHGGSEAYNLNISYQAKLLLQYDDSRGRMNNTPLQCTANI
jgi:hypothetical protein